MNNKCKFISHTSTASEKPLRVKEIGSFYVGGQDVTLEGLPTYEAVAVPGGAPRKVDPNGDFITGQMYVQYVQLADTKAKYPLLMWHGGGLTGSNWETKPDGQPGWQSFFLKAGHDIYISDAVERGRSSWSRYPELYKTEPVFRPKKEAWESFRIGPLYATNPSERIAFPGVLFPIDAFDEFMKQAVPRWTSNNAAIQAAYDQLLQKMGPCVLLVHSQAGPFAEKAALNAPDKVKAIVLLESAGSPNIEKENLAAVKNIPHLFIWGDNVQKYPTWAGPKGYYAISERYRDALVASGVPVSWIDLPQIGITGNSHMMMMDKNSDAIATIIQKWLEDQRLMK
ncbi:MAG: hypothetical protein ABFC84_07975 [Veillonellales bacterium]